MSSTADLLRDAAVAVERGDWNGAEVWASEALESVKLKFKGAERCPVCFGSGEIGWQTRARGDNEAAPPTRCKRCGGTGEVSVLPNGTTVAGGLTVDELDGAEAPYCDVCGENRVTVQLDEVGVCAECASARV